MDDGDGEGAEGRVNLMEEKKNKQPPTSRKRMKELGEPTREAKRRGRD